MLDEKMALACTIPNKLYLDLIKDKNEFITDGILDGTQFQCMLVAFSFLKMFNRIDKNDLSQWGEFLYNSLNGESLANIAKKDFVSFASDYTKLYMFELIKNHSNSENLRDITYTDDDLKNVSKLYLETTKRNQNDAVANYSVYTALAKSLISLFKLIEIN